MIQNQTGKISKWKELGAFLKGRTLSPLQHPEFIFYFIIIIIGAGALNIWATIYSECSNSNFSHLSIINSISSFSVAIIMTGSIELIFVTNKLIRITLFLISLGVMALSILIYFMTLGSDNVFTYYFVIPLVIFSLYIWWIGNAENANLTKNFFAEQSKVTAELTNSLDDYDDE